MRLLIVGDLSGQFGAASVIAQKRGAKVRQVPDVTTAIASLRNGHGADLVFIDVRDDVAGLVTGLAGEHICVPVVGCGFDQCSDDAARAIHAGAKEYLPLPPNEELIAAILHAMATQDEEGLLYQSAAMAKVVALADQVAASEATILITGASGTGKEVVARYLHSKSKRAGQPFISVNCAAIPENLLESEFFGHEKGAFTGAIARRIGKFEEAQRGTLLLDEISEIDMRLQAKLLRALQEREIDRVGGSGPIKLDIRVIATSNRDLQQAVRDGRFREDLLFRLNIIQVQLPLLAVRKEDILLLAQRFIERYARANGVAPRPLSAAAIAALEQHNWPGNVRELENTMHRAVLLASGECIEVENLMLVPTLPVEEPWLGSSLATMEREFIMRTVDHCLGSPEKAATILGISLKVLREKLAQYTAISDF
jgi:two-component system response regulator FlrC